ncbi:MAG: methylated-DNA--[protein]-cysteine S-methyltransferase [Dongiaceae bacterium]
MSLYRINVPSPLGLLCVSERAGKIVALDWSPAEQESSSPILAAAAQQLNAYFYCGLKQFELPLAPAGTAFQKSVWHAMLRIPYGQTRGYGEIAHDIDSGPRAIGNACGHNPIPIIIPCHRILASGRRVGGYTSPGGLDTKRFLLTLEGARLQS